MIIYVRGIREFMLALKIKEKDFFFFFEKKKKTYYYFKLQNNKIE